MTEYISREEAIKELREVYEQEYPTASGDFDEYASHDVPNVLRNIPAADVQPVKRGRWITKAEDYYKAWQDSGRSWDDMPYFVTGLKFACSNCFEQFDVNAEGVEKWNGCPLCLARMDGDTDA